MLEVITISSMMLRELFWLVWNSEYNLYSSHLFIAALLAACKKILCCSSKTCSEAVWGDLGIEPLDLRRNKRKVVLFSRLVRKGKDSSVKKSLKKME